MADTGTEQQRVKNISFDKRDKLYDAQFKHKGQTYRKKFKKINDAILWLQTQKDLVKQNGDTPH